MADVRDPLGLRDVIRFVDALQDKYVTPGKALPAAKVKEMADILEQFQEALLALDVIVDVDSKNKELGVRCLIIGQAFIRGEGDRVDTQGFLELGDQATELADVLYDYATED
jgi:hypothetical protein